MDAFVVVLVAWGVVTAVLLIRISREYRRGEVSTATAVLVWPWHALNYAILIGAPGLVRWPLGLGAAVAIPVGAALLVLGLLVIAAGFYEFRTARRLSGTQTDHVIDSGIYRYTRHPQYLGIILTFFGSALVERSAAALGFAAVLSAGLVLYVPAEERYVELSLGEPYRRYRRRTPMVLGLPPRD